LVDKPIRRRILLGEISMKQLKYMRDRSISSLEKKLNEALSQGWELFGDLTQLGGSYVQAMTKED